MKGVVFNLLEEVVCQAHGAQSWDALLAKADLAGAGDHHDEPLAIGHSRCMHYGDKKCLITVACA